MKSKSTAMWLAFFTGGLGGHKFYLDDSKAWIYLVFCWTYIPALVALFDAIGFARMSEDEFNAKYNAGSAPAQSQIQQSAQGALQSQQDAINQAVAVAVAATTAANAAQTAIHHANQQQAYRDPPRPAPSPLAFTCRSCGANNNLSPGAPAVCNFCGTPA
jgi:TM2 domain-containing membrane protein YozV